mmetsp:Transcript_17237/g.41502  ORF Transcript_17237/g.41502 Transcript_17237/m.41502 type:complete len:91 (-) Transcript_17237:78-350(-)
MSPRFFLSGAAQVCHSSSTTGVSSMLDKPTSLIMLSLSSAAGFSPSCTHHKLVNASKVNPKRNLVVVLGHPTIKLHATDGCNDKLVLGMP